MSIFYSKSGELIKAHVEHTLKSFYYVTEIALYYYVLEDQTRWVYPDAHWCMNEFANPVLEVLEKEIHAIKGNVESESATYTYTIDQHFVFLMAPVMDKGVTKGVLVAGPLTHCKCFSPCIGSNYTQETLSLLMRYKVVRAHPSHLYIAQLLHHLNRKSVYVGPNEVINKEEFYFTRDDMLSRTMSAHTHDRLELIAGLVEHSRKHEALTLYKKSILLQDFESPTLSGDFEMLRQNLITLETLISSAVLKDTMEAQKILQIKQQFFSQLIRTQDYHCLVNIGENIIKVYSETLRRKALDGLSKPVRKTMLYIQEHFKEPISMEDLCVVVDRSKSYLSSRFKKEVGQSITDYIKLTRTEYAKHLLLYTELSILQIALESGFDSQNYFSTVFKSVTGMTPMSYRSKVVSSVDHLGAD